MMHAALNLIPGVLGVWAAALLWEELHITGVTWYVGPLLFTLILAVAGLFAWGIRRIVE